MRVVQISEFGGPEVLEVVEVPDPVAGAGEVVIDVARAGLNFADTHLRRDDYLAKASLPLTPGGEVSGTTADGRRVAAMLMNGGYAEKVAVPEQSIVEVPDEVSDDQAAAILLQGLTAWALLTQSAKLETGDSVVIQAAGGGTGTLAIQLAKHLGAGNVIAMASTPEKRALAERLGADASIDSRTEPEGLTEALLEANGGHKVDVVLEMTGGPGFDACLEAIAPFGRLVSFGIASGQANTVGSADLMRTSRSVIGFWLVHLFQKPGLLGEGIGELLDGVAKGDIEVVVGGVYPMSEVAQAHIDMQERRTQGKLLLDPSK